MATNSTSSKHSIPMSNKYDRIILLVDMDCFYCQVEEKLDPNLKGKPMAVVQYNAWRGGGIIAVNYAARAKGVTRHMRGDEAKAQCPEIQLVKVPNIREKADLAKYREAGKDVANVLQRFTPLLERASVDEAYLDITDLVNKRHVAMNDGSFVLQPQQLINTYAVGFPTIGEYLTTITKKYINPLLDNDDSYRHFQENDIPAVRQSNVRLLIGSSIAKEIRDAVYAETGYECSAGIAHNKILAKLACGMNKPNKQTILPLAQIHDLFSSRPLSKIKGLGAKFGEEVCQRLGIRYLGQMLKFTEKELQHKFDEKNGTWLYNICRGIDLEAVTPRFYSKSIGCCKKFPGRNSINGLKTLQHWLLELANEIYDRLEKDVVENNRRAKQMVVNFAQDFNSEEIMSSRSAPINSQDSEALARSCLDLIKANTKQFFRAGSESVLNNPIKFLGISVGKFETISNSQNNIQDMFAQQAAKKKKSLEEEPSTSNEKMDKDENENEKTKTQKAPEKRNITDMFAKQAAKKKKYLEEEPSTSNKNMERDETTKAQNTIPPQASEKREVIGNISCNKKENILDSNTVVIGEVKEAKTTLLKSMFAKALKRKLIESEHDDEKQQKTKYEETFSSQLLNGNNAKKITTSTSSIAAESQNQKQSITANENLDSKDCHELPIDKNDNTVAKQKKAEKLGGFLNDEHVPRLPDKVVDLTRNSSPSKTVNEKLATSDKRLMVMNIGTGSQQNTTDDVTQETSIKVLNKELLPTATTFAIEDQPTSQSSNDELSALINDLETIQNVSDDTPSTSLNSKRKFCEISNESSTFDYRSEYAEFALPVFDTKFLQYANCSSCGAKILNDPISIQTHQDLHFAQELSQQQRVEFREQKQAKVCAAKSPPPAAGKTKSKKMTTTPNNSQKNNSLKEDITKFLQPPISSNETPPLCSVICDICKVPIKPCDIMEHKDFHLAKELQRKLNQLDVRTVDITKSISESTRKNLNSSTVIKPSKSKAITKPITQFFTQPNT
uniref:DNA polymerase eta n=1 Tax=Stomoxys calcitrans TaxID=35570 RepID=A0A1I8NMY4_STOCA